MLSWLRPCAMVDLALFLGNELPEIENEYDRLWQIEDPEEDPYRWVPSKQSNTTYL